MRIRCHLRKSPNASHTVVLPQKKNKSVKHKFRNRTFPAGNREKRMSDSVERRSRKNYTKFIRDIRNDRSEENVGTKNPSRKTWIQKRWGKKYKNEVFVSWVCKLPIKLNLQITYQVVSPITLWTYSLSTWLRLQQKGRMICFNYGKQF